MSTANLAQQSPVEAKNHLPAFSRFVWKEFRMLRGFWLAVAVIGVLEQWVSTLLMFDVRAVPAWMFASAWGAAALYGVGAAVTLFSAESEDGTRDFLKHLPGQWQPMFVGKIATAILSALLLAGLLCLAGWLIAGGQWPTNTEARSVVAIGGVAVFEAIAWGLLFSLWLRQPLLAAIAAIGSASVGAQVAIAATPHASAAFTSTAYQAATAYRLIVVAIVFAVDTWLASRWLTSAEGSAAGWRKRVSGFLGAANMLSKPTALATNLRTESEMAFQHHSKPSRRRMMVRLLWQTWRESWKTMLAAVPLALFLLAGLSFPLILMHNAQREIDLPLPALGGLFLPALFGALVFRADQRGGHREFLAAHAGQPRYVWLVRQAVWMLGLFFLFAIVSLVVWFMVGAEIQHALQNSLRNRGSGNFFSGLFRLDTIQNRWQTAFTLDRTIAFAWQFAFFAWTAIFTAYGLGQLCSILLRREVLAGFLALLLSMVLAAWVLVVAFWQLNPGWFVLPLGVGALLASWLRMPCWLEGRRGLRSWILPIAAVVFPLVGFGLMLPDARIAQLEAPSPEYPYFKASLSETVAQYETRQKRGQETADAYFRLHADLAANGKSQPALLDQLTALSQLPLCSFPESALLAGMPTYYQVQELKQTLFADAERLLKSGDLETALDRYLTVLRIESHELRGQSPSIVNHKFGERRWENTAEQRLVEHWATHSGQTRELLRMAIDKLEKCPARVAAPWDTILAEQQRLRAIVMENALPSFLHEQRPRWSGYLAFLANELPWERQRAGMALDFHTREKLNYLSAVMLFSSKDNQRLAMMLRNLVGKTSAWHASEVGQVLYHSQVGGDWEEFARVSELSLQASTSYLVTQEMERNYHFGGFLRNYVDSIARRRGLRLQLALIAYRLDHDSYPVALAKLVPDYLEKLPLDPYSAAPFLYRSQGFKYPLDHLRQVPANRPVFWSIGIGNTEPEETDVTAPGHDVDEPISVRMIRFVPTEWNSFYRHRNSVFPLPK